MITIQVPGDGKYSAKLMLVGEAPAKHEVEDKLPFTDASGELIFEALPMRRQDLYVTNVYKVRMPGDSISRINEVLSPEQQEEHREFLWKEIEAIKPYCILALGNTALEVLTGKSGIMKFRGSILTSLKYGIKVVGTIHPAALLHGAKGEKELFSWKQIVFLKFDCKRAVNESTFQQNNSPKRITTIAKSCQDLWQFMNRFKDAKKTGNDIETFKSIPLCCAIAPTYTEAIAIPLFNIPGPSNTSIEIIRSERIEMWKLYATYMANSQRKVGQNYNFDQTILERYGFKINNFYSDIILKMSVLYPEIPKSLAVQASLFTKQPYWKDEGKEYNPKKDRPDRLLSYMGIDAMVTLEVDDALELEFDNIVMGKGVLA